MKANCKHNEQKAGTGDLSSTENPMLLCIAESPPQSKKTTSKGKSKNASRHSPRPKSSKKLAAACDSTAKGFRPYWNDVVEENSSRLWLPTEIVFQDSLMTPSSGSLRKQEEKSWFSTKVAFPKNNDCVKICLQSVIASPVVSTANVEMLKAKTIRLYPNALQKQILEKWLSHSRYTYNKALEEITKNGLRNWMSLKTDLLKKLPAFLKDTPFQIKGATCKDACLAVKAARAKQGKAHFRSRKSPQQTCFIPSSALSEKGIYHTLLGKLKMSEKLPPMPKDSRLSKVGDAWWLFVPYATKTTASDNQGRIVALDPGVRTFQTFYATDSCGKIASEAAPTIFRLCKRLDELTSAFATCTQRFQKLKIRKSMFRLRRRIENLISELHWKTCKFLTDNFDVIILPPFSTSQMTRRDSRKINKKSVRSMLSLGHYKFRQRLAFKCIERGKTLLLQCEAYTSKTASWSGEIVDIGSKKVIHSQGISMDRDVNGARGIFLRALVDQPILSNFGSDTLPSSEIVVDDHI